MKNNLYRKLDDGTFELVWINDVEFSGNLSHNIPVGHTLISVNKNGQSRKYHVEPDTVALLAAAVDLSTQLAKLLAEAGHPLTRNYTPEQLELFSQLKETGVNSLWFPSYHDTAERFMEILIKHVESVYDSTWIKDTREKYLSAITLSLENNA